MIGFRSQGIGQLLTDLKKIPTAVGQGASSAYDFVEEDPERAALLGALVSPDPYVGTTAGITEAFGYYPDPFNPGEYLPSVAGSLREGDYVGAGLTSLGALPIVGGLFGAAKAARLAKAKQLADKKKAADEGVPPEQVEMELGPTPEPEKTKAEYNSAIGEARKSGNTELQQQLIIERDNFYPKKQKEQRKTEEEKQQIAEEIRKREEFPPEAIVNMDGDVVPSGRGQGIVSSRQFKSRMSDETSTEPMYLETRSRLGNALFNPNSFLQVGEEGISSKEIKTQLQRMNVSENELRASGISTLLDENETISLKKLQETYSKYAPRMRVIRPHVNATDAKNYKHQRWLPMPGDYSNMIDPTTGEALQPYNVIDYEELVFFNDSPESSNLSKARRSTSGHPEYDYTQEGEYIAGRIGHSRGSVVTEFDDPVVNEDFPNGAYVIEEIQSNLSKEVVPLKEGGNRRQQLLASLNSSEQLGRERMKDFNELLQDDELMHEVSSLINPEHEFNTGSFDFAPDARAKLNNQSRDKTELNDPENIDDDALERLNSVYAYLNGAMTEREFLARNTNNPYTYTQSNNPFGPGETFGKYMVELKNSGKVSVPSSKLDDALAKMNAVSDAKRDIKTLRKDLNEAGDVLVLNADNKRKMDEVVEPFIERMQPLFDKKRSLTEEAAAGRVPKSIEVLETKDPEVQAKLKSQMAASDEFDGLTDQLDEAARQLQKDDPEAFELLASVKPELISDKVQGGSKLFDSQTGRNNPVLINDFPFASETDYIKHAVDTIVQKAQAKGLSGVIVPSWEEIAALRGYKEGEVAWNQFKRTYGDTIKKRFKELEKANPGSKFRSKVDINSPFARVEPNGNAIGYTFAPLSSNQKVAPPPLSLAKGGEVKIHDGIGAMAKEVL